MTIDETRGKNLFYYFVASERNPSEDPVVLWLNGGPGCSSFDGFVYEHGPFNFQQGNGSGNLPQLHLNPYSWSKVIIRALVALTHIIYGFFFWQTKRN